MRIELTLVERRHQSASAGDRPVIGGKVPPGALPPSSDQAGALWDRYQAAAVCPASWRERLARLDSRFRRRAARDVKYAHYGELPRLWLVPEPQLRSCGAWRDHYAMYGKGRPYYALFTRDQSIVTEPFARAASDEELLQLLVHARTVTVGLESVNQLNLAVAELVTLLDRLRELNAKKSGWGISRYQQADVIAQAAGADLDAAITALDVAPSKSQRVKVNAIEVAAALRERDFDDPHGFANGSALDRKIEQLAREEIVPPPVRITFVSFGSPWHYALWNNLSIDTLAGDLYGEFGAGVSIALKRAVSEATVDKVVAEVRQSPPDILGLSVELGTLSLVDRYAEGFARIPERERPLLILGNQVPTYFPERFVEHSMFPDALVCLHEGEFTMRGLIEHVRTGQSLADVPNLVYKDSRTGALVRTPLRTLDLSALPHAPTADTAKPGITNMIQASRGCIFSCAYCTRHETFDAGVKLRTGEGDDVVDESHNWRPFALPRIFEAVEGFVTKGITEIEFCDDEFFGGRSAGPLRRVNDFAAGMKTIARKYDTRLTFRIFTTPLIVARARDDARIRKQNEEVRATLEHLVDAGLVRVYIGLESASPVQKRRYGRKETVDDTAAALQVLRGLGLDVDVGFIMFDPHLSVEEMLDNVEYFRRYDVVKHNTWPFRPLVVNEGTPIKRRLEAEGLLTGKQDADFLAYEYRYRDPIVERIATSVQNIAQATGALFWTLKTVSKTHWKGHETADVRFAREAVERNAWIYLDLMERLGRAALDGSLPLVEQACEDDTRAALMDLVGAVRQKFDQGLFDVRAEDRESLERHLQRFEREHLPVYEQACARVRAAALRAS